MPIYEFQCKKCGEHFSLAEPLKEHDKHEEKCPKCGGQEVEQVIAAVNVRTSKKS